ncbi:type II toxin-antitoxin system PemK/MazF family toxin [Frankia sp. Cppng1_Ct_nod]|uniref:type II toxin-antitoxin system PemK/MazF family toxin n=1 Tax=Frankia sp. Cppng1_Ct_nod TaxID=2897162 RepID=UPI0010411C11|nr:type II toxin-antitoxin system PemK/MazF family toxin [Frankia sp. Cppng1_Ct_nod]
MKPPPRRGAVWVARLPPPAGARPVVIITRDTALPYLTNVTVVPVTRTIRGIPSEVPIGPAEGLKVDSVASCDNIMTIPSELLVTQIGILGPALLRRLSAAIRLAVDV